VGKRGSSTFSRGALDRGTESAVASTKTGARNKVNSSRLSPFCPMLWGDLLHISNTFILAMVNKKEVRVPLQPKESILDPFESTIRKRSRN